MSKKLGLTIGVAILAAASWLAPAQAAGVKIGVLTCNVDSGWGYILGSSKDVRCNYVPNKGFGEHYVGSVSKVGVDIGYTKGGVLIWDVIAPSSDMKPGALEGNYGGVSASATVGIGAGANVLLGGFDKSVALQPISIEGNTGLNVAAGIGALDLKFEKG
ncbi:MAG TPA: DUF992 domain-containing protein [Micropepsaceae bacterium]